MTPKFSDPFIKTVCLGTLAGMRTFAAPAVASHILSRNNSRALRGTPLNFMQSKITAIVFKVLAAGELVGDKQSSAPNRTSPMGLVGRALSGALAGAAIYQASGSKKVKGAFIGGAAAVASIYLSFNLRKQIVKATGYADPYIGITEDILVLAGAAALVIND